MTISRKTTIISTGILFAAFVFFTAFYGFITGAAQKNQESIAAQLDENDRKLVDSQIVALGDNIANYLISMEDEIDRTMRNAALVLQERASRGPLSDDVLLALAKTTGMDDLYLAGTDGVFYQSTEASAIGVSIFSIWEGYRMLVDGQAAELPSAIKIKVETGEIFKFTAIPKLGADGNVDGILEAALNASTSVATLMQGQIERNPQLNAISIIESTGLVLTNSVRPGRPSTFQPGGTVADAEILDVARQDRPLLKWSDDRASVVYGKAVPRFGAPAYILYLSIDPAGYLENTRFVKSQFEALEANYNKALLTVAVVSAALILLVICIYMFFIRRALLAPIHRVARIMGNISEGGGDLTERIDIRSRDEIGAFAEKFNLFVEKIKHIVHDAKNAAGVITHSSSEVVRNLDDSYNGIKDISSSVRNLSENIARQVRNANDSQTISEQLSQDFGYLSLQIEEAVQTVERILRNKETGEGKISLLVDKNTQSLESSRKSAEDIRALNEQIVNIHGIVDEIKAVAKQTQLLSLNASIEAARAGEQGRGFAVVAANVNELAEASATSALKIESIIDAIRASSAESVEAVAGVMDIAHEQAEHVQEVEKTFAAITDEIDRIKTVFDNLDQAIATVGSAKDTMTGYIRDLSRVSGDNQDSVSVVERSMDSQVRVVENIRNLSGKTADTIGDLGDTLNRFRVE